MLLTVKNFLEGQSGNTVLEVSNTFPDMGKTSARKALADNVKALQGAQSTGQVSDKSDVSQKTVWNAAYGTTDPQLSTIEAIASKFGIEAYQLICPMDDKKFLFIAKAYAQTNEAGRLLLETAAQTAWEMRNRESAGEAE